MKSRRWLLLVLPLLVAPLLAAAQPPEGPQRDRARTFLVLRISDALKLSEQDALKVSNVIRQSDEHRQELVQQPVMRHGIAQPEIPAQPPDEQPQGRVQGEHPLRQTAGLFGRTGIMHVAHHPDGRAARLWTRLAGGHARPDHIQGGGLRGGRVHH